MDLQVDFLAAAQEFPFAKSFPRLYLILSPNKKSRAKVGNVANGTLEPC